MHSSQFGITFTDSRGPVNSDGPIHCIRSLNRMVRYSVMPLPGGPCPCCWSQIETIMSCTSCQNRTSTSLITPNSSPSPPPALPPPLPQELHHQETMASFSTFRQGRTSTLISSSKAFPPPFSQYLRHQEMTSRSPLYQ